MCTSSLLVKFIMLNLFVFGYSHILFLSEKNNFLLPKKFLEIIQTQRSQTGFVCKLKFISIHHFENSHFYLVTTFNEPYQLLTQVETKHANAFPKFTPNCWTAIISIQSEKFVSTLTQDKYILGDHVQDYYFFVSNSAQLLRSVLTCVAIMDKYSRKYGIFVNSGVTLSYIIEPESYTGGVITTNKISFKSKFNNLSGRTLKVAYFNIAPYIAKLNNKLDGVQYNLMTETAQRTNLTLKFYSDLKTPGFGLLNVTSGTWTGLMDELVSDRAHCIPYIGPSIHRSKFLSIISGPVIMPLVLCMKSPKAYRSWHAIVDPLNLIVWGSIFVTFGVVAVIYACINKMEINRSTRDHIKISRALFLLYSTFLEQSHNLPSQNVTRLVITMWLFFGIVMVTAYSSNLITSLTFLRSETVPLTFRELHEAPSYSVTFFSVGGMENELMRNSPTPFMKGIVKRMHITRNVMECLNAATHDKAACIGWSEYLQYAIAKNSGINTSLQNLFIPKTEPAGVVHGSVGFKKGSIFHETFSRYGGAASAGYLIEYWLDTFNLRVKAEAVREAKNKGLLKSEVIDGLSDSPRPLNVGDLMIVFWVIFCGSFVAILGFIIETLSRLNMQIALVWNMSCLQVWMLVTK